MYLILSYFNRFSHDDLGYLKGVQTDGVIGSTLENYENWNTRWAAILLANSFFYFIKQNNLLWVFHVISFLVLLFSVHKLFTSVRRTVGFRIKFGEQAAFSFLFVLLLFFNTFSIGDVWFWLNAACMYLWNVSAAFFAFAFILNKGRIGIKAILISTDLFAWIQKSVLPDYPLE